MAGSPEGVFTGRLVGGPLDGIEPEIEPGTEAVELGAPFLAVFGSPPEHVERVKRSRWHYRYSHVEPRDGADRVAVFEFVGEIDAEPRVDGES